MQIINNQRGYSINNTDVWYVRVGTGDDAYVFRFSFA